MSLRICVTIGSMRLAGMMLPGNGWPVSGSLITVVVSEKFPERSAAVSDRIELVPGDERRLVPW